MINNLTKILITALLVIDIYILLFLKVDINSVYLNWKKVPQTTTELYFTKHLELPKQIEANENYSFQFTTHNLEQKDVNYSYSVILSFGNQNLVIDEGSFLLGHDNYRTVPVYFSVNENFDRGKIIVVLNNNNQQISFWSQES